MIKILKQKATSLLQLFFSTNEERDRFRLFPFVIIVLLMLAFVAGFVYVAVNSLR